MMWNKAHTACLATLLLVSQSWAQQVGPLPDIQRGHIAVHLQPIVTGLGAPDYAISPAGDLDFYKFIFTVGDLVTINADSTATQDMRATLYSSTEFKKVRLLYFTDEFKNWEREHAGA